MTKFKIGLVVFFISILASSCNRPVAKFLFSQNSVSAPSQVSFENISEKAEFFEWSFGDGKTSVEKNPNHKFYKSGTYEVTLTAITEKKISEYKTIINVEKPKKTMVEIQTPYGNMIAELYDETPQHRDNFKKLANEGFYDDLLFHRVINGFMIQGGDPQSKEAPKGQPLGSGGPGYTVEAEMDKGFVHVKGALAAARTGDPVNPERRSSGSQFYIVHGNPVDEGDFSMLERRTGNTYSDDQKELYAKNGGTPFLDNQYTVFGRVIDGLEVIDKIAEVNTDQRDRPVEDVQMKILVIE